MLVYEAMAELIRREGPKVVFGLCGSSNVAWIGKAVEDGVFRYVRTRHEETALTAAVAYARVTGETAIATTTLGPGFANTINSLAAAIRDHIPVVLIVGGSPSNKMFGLQDLNQEGLVKALDAGWHDVRKPEQLEGAYWAAMRAAGWNGTPQVLSLDEGLLDLEITLSNDPPPPPIENDPPDAESVSAAVDVLAAAQYPLIIAGWGAMRADCHDDLVELAGLVGARVANTLNANRFFAGHPADLGVCGQSSPPVVLEELAKTDAVLAVGASLNKFTTGDDGIFPGAKIIQCELDIDRDFKASAPELGLLGDAKASVRALIDEWKKRGLEAKPVNGGVPTLAEIQESILKVDLGHDPERGLDLRRVYYVMNQKLPADRVVVTDGGRAGHSLPSLIDAQDARSWLTSRGYGSIGLGMGAAIGAAAAAPDRRVALFSGDGGFMMAAQELDAIRLNGLNVTIVVMDDEQYGSEIKYLKKFDLDYGVARQSMPDAVMLARAFGGDGVVLQTEEDLEKVELPESGLFLVHARIDPEVDGRAV